MDYEYAEVMKILRQFSQLDFVKRILDPDFAPRLDLGGGEYATHRMAWSEVDGQYLVYPTVAMVEGKLVDLGEQALDVAMKTKEYIPFKSPDRAAWFSHRYKAAWGE